MMNTSVYRFSTRLLASVMIATLAVSNLPLMPIAEIHASSGAVTTTIGGQTSLPDWDALGVKTQLLRSELLIPSSWGKTTLTIRAPKYVGFTNFGIEQQSVDIQPYIESVTSETIGEESILKYTFVEHAPSKMTLDYTITTYPALTDKIENFQIKSILTDTINVQQATPVDITAKYNRTYTSDVHYSTTTPMIGTKVIIVTQIMATSYLNNAPDHPEGLNESEVRVQIPEWLEFVPEESNPRYHIETSGGNHYLVMAKLKEDIFIRHSAVFRVKNNIPEGTIFSDGNISYTYKQANSIYTTVATSPTLTVTPYVETLHQHFQQHTTMIGSKNQYLGKWGYQNETNRDLINARVKLDVPEGVQVRGIRVINLPSDIRFEYTISNGETKTVPVQVGHGLPADLGLGADNYITSMTIHYDRLAQLTGQAYYQFWAEGAPWSNIVLIGNIPTHLPNGTALTTSDMMKWTMSMEADNMTKIEKVQEHPYTDVGEIAITFQSWINGYKNYFYPGDTLIFNGSLFLNDYPYASYKNKKTWSKPHYYIRIPKGFTLDTNQTIFPNFDIYPAQVDTRIANDGATIIHVSYPNIPREWYGPFNYNPNIFPTVALRIDENIELKHYDLQSEYLFTIPTEAVDGEAIRYGWQIIPKADQYDLDNDGDTTEIFVTSEQVMNKIDFNVLLPKVLSVYGNSHSLPDPTKKIYKESDATTTTNIDPHQTFSYEKALLNGTDAPMTNYTSYIVLPRQGDSEASAYNVYLAGGLSGALPAGTTLEYITSDMSRITTLPELQSVTSTTTLPADLKSVTALKLTLPQVDPYTRLFYTFPLMTDITPDVGATAYVRQYFATMDTALATPILGSSKSAYKVQPYTISGKVFMDRNDDRRAQTGEELSDIALSLKVGDTVITSTTTSTDGSYTFTLPDHTRYYTVVVDTRSYDILPKTATAFDGGSMMDANYTSDQINAGALRASVTDLNVGFYDAALYPPLIVATPTLTISTEFNGTIPILSGTLGGQPINPADVTITPTSPLPTGVRIDGDTLVVDLKLPPGKIEVTYTVCEKARPRNCTTVTTDISVKVPTNTNGNNGHNGSNGNGGGGGGYTIPTNNGGNTNGNNGGNTTPTKVHNSAPTNPYPIPSGHPSGLTSAMDGEFTLSSNGGSTMINTTKLNWKDNFCFSPLKATTFHESVEGGDEKLSGWFMLAHNMLYNYQLTSWSGSASFRPHLELTREEAAKFLVEFANNVLCRKPIKTYDNNFNDLHHANETLRPYIIASYEYGIFQGDEGKIPTTFRPKDVISLDEMMAILIRVTTAKFLDEGIRSTWAMPYKRMLNLLTPNSSLTSVTRGNVAEVLFDLYISNDYELTPNGYVLKK